MAYEDIFAKASKTYGVDVNLLKAVAQTESNFNPKAVSKAGAVGVMQLMPGTATYLGVKDRYDPEQNIMGGAKYLAELLEYWDGDVEKSLASYNAGSGNVKKYGKEKYSSYYTKVLSYMGSSTTDSPTTYTPTTSTEVGLKWWGDIVAVVILVLLVGFGLLFIVMAIGISPTDLGVKGVAKKALKGVK